MGSLGAEGLERVSLHLLHLQTNIYFTSYEPPSLPLWVTRGYWLEGKASWGSLQLRGCTGQQLPSSYQCFALGLPRFTCFSKAPDDTDLSFVPWSFLQVKEVLPCPGEDETHG